MVAVIELKNGDERHYYGLERETEIRRYEVKIEHVKELFHILEIDRVIVKVIHDFVSTMLVMTVILWVFKRSTKFHKFPNICKIARCL